MRLNPVASGTTVLIVAVLWYVIGAIFNVLSPWGSAAVVSYIFHVDTVTLARPFTWDSFLVGVSVCAAGGFFWGHAGATIYNRLVARQTASVPAAQPIAHKA